MPKCTAKQRRAAHASAPRPAPPPEAPLSASPALEDEWARTCARLPAGWQTLLEETHALVRRRKVQTAEVALRLVLAYSLCDWSFRMVGLWLTVCGLPSLSDVAIRQRVRKAGPFLGALVGACLRLRALTPVAREDGRAAPLRVHIVDASSASEPGSRGTNWRLHAVFDLARACLAQVEVTTAKGGETLKRFAFGATDLVLGDRGYAHRAGLATLFATATAFVIRCNRTNLAFESEQAQPFDLAPWLQRGLSETPPTPIETQVWISTPAGRHALRLAGHPLPHAAAEKAVRRMRRNARKKHHTLDPRTELSARFVLLVSNLPQAAWPLATLFALYRLRWQVELLFKRLKSLVHFDHLRAKDAQVAQAYLLGKVLGLLLCEGLPAECPELVTQWIQQAERPFCHWRWVQSCIECLCQALRGNFSRTRILACLPHLARYLCAPPRSRVHQRARAQAACARLGLPV